MFSEMNIDQRDIMDRRPIQKLRDIMDVLCTIWGIILVGFIDGKGRAPSKMQQISSMGRAGWISRHPSIICRDIMDGYPVNYG